MTSHESQGASEVAEMLAALAIDRHAFPDGAARDLMRLLSQALAQPAAADERQARLGLLIDLVREGRDYVTIDAYQRARAARAKRGEDWPSASTLSRAMGHWLAAVQAASRFWFDGGPARVRAERSSAGRHAGYQPRQIVVAIRTFHREHGEWPTAWEWERYIAIRRRLDRRSGRGRRWPGLGQLRKAYGSFAGAVAAAERTVPAIGPHASGPKGRPRSRSTAKEDGEDSGVGYNVERSRATQRRI